MNHWLSLVFPLDILGDNQAKKSLREGLWNGEIWAKLEAKLKKSDREKVYIEWDRQDFRSKVLDSKIGATRKYSEDALADLVNKEKARDEESRFQNEKLLLERVLKESCHPNAEGGEINPELAKTLKRLVRKNRNRDGPTYSDYLWREVLIRGADAFNLQLFLGEFSLNGPPLDERWNSFRLGKPCEKCDAGKKLRRVHLEIFHVWDLHRRLGGKPGKNENNVRERLYRKFPHLEILFGRKYLGFKTLCRGNAGA